MKRIMLVVAVLLFAGLGVTLPGFSEEDSERLRKDECLLIARNCGGSARSIQDKVERLHEEIGKGKRVYTKEELKVLKDKLDEVDRVLDFLGDKPPYLPER